DALPERGGSERHHAGGGAKVEQARAFDEAAQRVERREHAACIAWLYADVQNISIFFLLAMGRMGSMKRALIVLFLAGCGPDLAVPQQQGEPPPPAMQQDAQKAPPVEVAPLTGLPCDVQAAMQANCAGCHVGAVYIPAFATRDDLLKLGTK